MTIIDEILNTLNSAELSYNDKLLKLRDMCKHRRGNNLATVKIVINILEEWFLPVSNSNFVDGKNAFYNADVKVYDNICKIAEKSRMTLFNAISNELLFYHFHKIQMAEKSIISYFSELITPTKKDEFSFMRHSLGICRLFAKIGVKYIDGEKFVKLCIGYIDDYKDKNYSPLHLLLALRRINAYSETVDKKLFELIGYYDSNKNYRKSIAYREKIIEINKKDKQLVEKLRWENINLLEQQANTFDWNDSANSFQIINLIQQAMNLLNKINSKEAKSKRKRLAKKIEPVKKLSLKEIKLFSSGPFDISPATDNFENIIKKTSLEESIAALVFSVNPKELTEIKEETNKNSSITSLFSSNVLDSKGKVICIIPSLLDATDEDKMHYYEHEAMKYNLLLSNAFISNFLNIFNRHHNINKEVIKFILENNLFVPNKRIESFSTGIEAGFKYDFITALHILMPQVENAIRTLAEELGAVVYKTADDGTEECLSFESVLSLPEVTESFDEDFIFNLKVFYTSKYGFGMRNNIGHGLIEDNELNSYHGLVVWWYTLRLCCTYSYNLRKRILEIKQGQ